MQIEKRVFNHCNLLISLRSQWLLLVEKMVSLQTLSLGLLLFVNAQGFFRSRRLRLNLKKCTIKYCSGTRWKDDWHPSVPRGKCVKQSRASQGLYSSKTVVLPQCPSTICCPSETQSRTMCKYKSFVLLVLYRYIVYNLQSVWILEFCIWCSWIINVYSRDFFYCLFFRSYTVHYIRSRAAKFLLDFFATK